MESQKSIDYYHWRPPRVQILLPTVYWYSYLLTPTGIPTLEPCARWESTNNVISSFALLPMNRLTIDLTPTQPSAVSWTYRATRLEASAEAFKTTLNLGDCGCLYSRSRWWPLLSLLCLPAPMFCYCSISGLGVPGKISAVVGATIRDLNWY